MSPEQQGTANKYWLWRLLEDVRGPFTAGEVRAMARRGELLGEDRLAVAPGRWVQAGRVPGLLEDWQASAADREIAELLDSGDEGLTRLALAKIRALGARSDIHLVQLLAASCLALRDDEDEMFRKIRVEVAGTIADVGGIWGRIGRGLRAAFERDEHPDAGTILQIAEQAGGPRAALEVAATLGPVPAMAWALLHMDESQGGWHRQALACLPSWHVIEAGNKVGEGQRIVPLEMLRRMTKTQLELTDEGCLADPDTVENGSLSVVIAGDGRPLEEWMADCIHSWIPPQLWQELRLVDCPGEFQRLLNARADAVDWLESQGEEPERLEIMFERCGSVVGAGQQVTEWDDVEDVEPIGSVRFERCPRIDRDFMRSLAPRVHGTLGISGAMALPDLSGIVCPWIECLRLEKVPISQVPAWLVDGSVFPALTELFIEECGVVSLGAARWNLPQLRRLRLDGNMLCGVGSALRDLSGLDTLELADNRITRIDPGQVPAAAFATAEGSILKLSGNPLAHCPELPYAENTSLKGTMLESLPTPQGGVGHLKELQVPSALGRLPSWLRQAGALSELEVGESGVQELPAWLWNLSHLRALGAEGLRGVRVEMAQAWVDADTDVPIRVDLENCTFAQGCTGPTAPPSRHGSGTHAGAGHELTIDQDQELVLDPDGTDAEELVLDLDAMGVEEPQLEVQADTDSFELDLDDAAIPGGSASEDPSEEQEDEEDPDVEDDDDQGEDADEAPAKPAEYAFSLSGTSLTAVPEWLRHVPLRELKLDRAPIRHLPDWAAGWTRLREFEAAGSALESLSDWIGAWSACELIDVSTTLVGHLPDSIGQLTQLQVLRLDGCPLERLPESLGQCTALSSLKVEDTRITQLPASLRSLPSLSLLDLSGTALASLPDWIGDMPGLQTLCLDRTGVERLPASIGRLTQLSTLSLSGSAIHQIPPEIEACRMLTDIRLHDVRSLSADSVRLLERLSDRIEISVDTDGPLAHLARRT